MTTTVPTKGRPVLNAFEAERQWREQNPARAAEEDRQHKMNLERAKIRRTLRPKPLKKIKESINPFKLSRTIIFSRDYE